MHKKSEPAGQDAPTNRFRVSPPSSLPWRLKTEAPCAGQIRPRSWASSMPASRGSRPAVLALGLLCFWKEEAGALVEHMDGDMRVGFVVVPVALNKSFFLVFTMRFVDRRPCNRSKLQSSQIRRCSTFKSHGRRQLATTPPVMSMLLKADRGHRSLYQRIHLRLCMPLVDIAAPRCP